jgi:hypothetical protein
MAAKSMRPSAGAWEYPAADQRTTLHRQAIMTFIISSFSELRTVLCSQKKVL